jgi:ribosomal protein S12 methylthiotransferase accessory factor
MNMKKYKADSPENTVERIREIIAHLGIPHREIALGDGKMFFSCRITITRDDDSSIGTNGKGMSNSFARASGYAEFMERLQNRVIIYPNPASYGAACRFFPDEKDYCWTHDEAEANIKKFTPKVLSPKTGLKAQKVGGKAIPFYHVNSSKTIDLPYSLIRWTNGSNGMCEGNIREEALIQGFNEIFERYCIQEMYLRKITPPDIPLSEFQGSDILKRLEYVRDTYGMDFRVKDISLGEGFPVLGLLLYNPDKTKYIVHLGADLNARVALERCFTEIFQGYTAETLRFDNDVNDCEKLDLFNEFKRSLMYGRGRQYTSFFDKKPSYPYQGHTTIPEGRDFREDLHNICQWIMDKGYDIYIRDNSFLGFPTLHIVVPGLSEIGSTFFDLNRRVDHMQLTENRLNPLFRLRTLDIEECKETIAYLEQLHDNGIALFTRNNNPNNFVNRHLLLMILYVATYQNDLALQHLKAYEQSCLQIGKEMKDYYQDIKRLLQGEEVDTATNHARMAHAFLSHPEKALHTIASPNCFDCDHCEISQGCRYPLLREIEDIIQHAMADKMIDQNTLKEIFK